jgi:murein L,D-transpeptidase YafK
MKIVVLVAVTLLFLLIGVILGITVWSTDKGHPLALNARADKILVNKSERVMMLLRQGKTLKAYRIALGPAPCGHKVCEGDGRTPEGSYKIDARKLNSSFHRALHVSYPNARDVLVAKGRGLDPGGAIMIHGLPNGMGWYGNLHRWWDWTAGCIAVTDWEIEEIWRAVPDGTMIEIRP